jgi:hypothetical protein
MTNDNPRDTEPAGLEFAVGHNTKFTKIEKGVLICSE